MYVRTVRIENSTIHTYNYVRTEVNHGFNIIFFTKKKYVVRTPHMVIDI